MTSRLVALFPILVLLLGAGCGNTVIRADDYDRTCTASSDCAVIYAGDRCACVCDAQAINKRDLARYQADADAVECRNDERSVCGACQTVAADCEAGRCVAVVATSP